MLFDVIKNCKMNTRLYWNTLAVFCLSAFVLVLPEAMAQTDAISGVLCAIVNRLNGPIGRGIATIAIIVLGIGLFLGKLSWGLAVATALGIGLIFGSAQMVAWIGQAGSGGSTTMSSSCSS